MIQTASDDKTRLRKVYGRGFYDGIEKALATMNTAKLRATEAALTGMVKKVLGFVSTEEVRSIAQVCGAMHNETGSRPDQRVVSGCLNTLVERGMVKEPQKGHFLRIADEKKPEPKVLPEPASAVIRMMPALQVSTPAHDFGLQDGDAMDRLAGIAKRLGGIADVVRNLVSDLEDVALDVETKMHKINTDTAKLRQLQELLKSLT